ncbi:MAG: GIY-YIG nuclease family protein [Dehalococcoidia bacterium]|jgi:putative endonuclease
MVKDQFYIYIICNKNNSSLYTGVTSDLVKRVSEHRAKVADGFSKRYNLEKLVYYEIAGNAEAAIQREKQLKAGRRRKKIELIEGMNPLWRDLYPEL